MLTLKLPLAVFSNLPFPLSLARKKLGELRFDCGEIYPITEPLFYGDWFDSQSAPPSSPLQPVLLRNHGDDAVRVSRPIVTHQSRPGGVEWLQVGWGDGDKDAAEKQLRSGQKLAVRLIIDLTRLKKADLPPKSPLTGTIQVRDLDNNLTRPLTLRIARVDERETLKSPLAIDFGNTNTLAAVIESGGIRPVLGLAGDPFPSALFAAESEGDDDDEGEGIEFLAGPKALDRGAKDPARLIRGLKRELSAANDGDPPQYVFAIADGRSEARFGYGDLIGRYLERVIEECESRLRRTVDQVGLSYPANFSPQARARLDAVLREVEAKRPPDRPLKFEPLSTDEATAVALSFVLDVNKLKETILRRVGEEGDPTRPFLVAAFDFGGGSIDCALSRFRVTGSLDQPTYEGEPLGIGGDEHFGGDNVTVAVFELLEDRLRAVLDPVMKAARVNMPLARADQKRREVSTIAWENFHHLWEAAEGVKQFACQTGLTEDDHSRVKKVFDDLLSGLRVEPIDHSRPRKLTEFGSLEQAFRKAQGEARLLVGLDQIYTHSIRHDLSGGSNYTVADRVERCVVRLKQYLERSGSPSPEGPDFVVMAGAGCHLPLARELLAKAFGKAELLFDLPHAKSKVAFGLIRYLDLRLFNEEAVRDVRPASDFSHADLSWRGGRIGKPILWVPSCSPLFKATSYHLPNRVLSEIWNNDRQILVLRDRAPEPEVIGYFDLKGATQPGGPGVESALPADLKVNRDAGGQAAVRFLVEEGENPLGEDQLLLRIDGLAGRTYGDWKLIPGSPPPRPGRP